MLKKLLVTASLFAMAGSAAAAPCIGCIPVPLPTDTVVVTQRDKTSFPAAITVLPIGTVTFSNGSLTDSTQQANSVADFVSFNKNYVDNLITFQNTSISMSGQCGNSAIRIKDDTGWEYAAFGAIQPINSQDSNQVCTAGYDGGNTAYVEVSVLTNYARPLGNFSVNFSPNGMSTGSINTNYQPFIINGMNGHFYFDSPTQGFMEVDPVGEVTSWYGSDACGAIQINPAPYTGLNLIHAANCHNAAQGIALGDINGGGAFLNSYGVTAFSAVAVSASAVNSIRTGANVTTQAPQISAIGSDTNIDIDFEPKGTGILRVKGNAGVSCSGSPTSSFASVDGLITHC